MPATVWVKMAPHPPPVPPVPQLEPTTVNDDENFGLVIDTGMASVKVSMHSLDSVTYSY